MLGDRRNHSLFASAAATSVPESKPEQAEVHDIAFEEDTGRSIFAESKVAPKASDLFFAPLDKGMPFAEVLSQVQSYLSGTYATLITDSGDEAKEQMKRRIARYLQDNRMAVDGMTQGELVDALYTEMAEYGFLTKYIFAEGIEEIDINSWRDIEIQYSDGRTVKLDEHFDSPDHAANVIRRMLQNSGKVLDNASPIITSRLAKNIRVSVIKTPRAGRGRRCCGLHPNRQSQESDQGGLCGQRNRYGGNAGLSVCLPALWCLHLCGWRHQLRQNHRGGLAHVHHSRPQADLHH